MFNNSHFNTSLPVIYFGTYSGVNIPIYPTLVDINLNTTSKLYITRFFNPKILYIDSRNKYNAGFNSPQSVNLSTNTIFECNNFYSGILTIPNSGIPYLNVLFGACLTDGAYPKTWQISSTNDDTNTWISISNERSFYKLFKYSEEFYYRIIDNFDRIWTSDNSININELTADFTCDVSSNYYPLEVQFTAISNGTEEAHTQYLWEYAHEDNSQNWIVFSRERDPSFNFEISGKYDIRFTVSTPDGENVVSETKYEYINAIFYHPINIIYSRWD